jgi:hypothetical protein
MWGDIKGLKVSDMIHQNGERFDFNGTPLTMTLELYQNREVVAGVPRVSFYGNTFLATLLTPLHVPLNRLRFI